MRKFLLKRHRLALALLMLFAAFTQAKADDNVAKIGDTEYATLQSAIDAATSGQTVTLISNVSDFNQIYQISKSITLDLNGCTISGTGGKFSETGSYQSMFYCSLNTAGITITDGKGGGAINVEASSDKPLYFINFAGKSDLKLEGGTISVKNTGSANAFAIHHSGSGTVYVSGATINATAATGYAVGINNGAGTVNVSSGEVNATANGNGDADGIIVYGTANITGGKITAKATGTVYGLRSYGTTSVSKDAYISATSSNNKGYCLTAEKGGAFTMEGGTLYTETVNGVNVASGANSSIISGGKIHANVPTKGLINNVDGSALTVTGGYFNGSSVSGYAEGYNLYPLGLDTELSSEGYSYYVGTENVNVARFDNTTDYYATLQGAFDAATTDKNYIMLLKDASGDGVMLKAAKKTVTLNLEGHTYDVSGNLVGSTGTEGQGFHFEKGWNITIKNGTLKASAVKNITSYTGRMVIQNYADLTLDGVTVDGTDINRNYSSDFVVSVNAGSLITKGQSKILATDGYKALDFYYSNSYSDGFTATIGSGATINGAVYYRSGTYDTTWVAKANVNIDGSVNLDNAGFNYPTYVTPNLTYGGKNITEIDFAAKVGSTWYTTVDAAYKNGANNTVFIYKAGTYTLPDLSATKMNINGLNVTDGDVLFDLSDKTEPISIFNSNFYGVKFKLGTTDGVGFKADDNALYFYKCTFEGQLTTLGSKATYFNGCTFTQATGAEYCVLAQATQTTFQTYTYNKTPYYCTFNCDASEAIKLYSTDGVARKVGVTSCVFNSTNSTTKPAVMVYATDSNGNAATYTLNVSGGTVADNFLASADVQAKASNNLWGVNVAESSTTKVYESNEQMFPSLGDVAQIGENKYQTFAAAINAIADNQTVKILNNLTIDTNKSLGLSSALNSKIYTIDLNGYTLKFKQLSIYDNVTITDSSTVGNGSIVSTNAGATTVWVYGTVNITGGNLISTDVNTDASDNYSTCTPLVIASGGVCTISGGKITTAKAQYGAVNVQRGGSLIVENGADISNTGSNTFYRAGEGGNSGINAESGSTLTINGGSISSLGTAVYAAMYNTNAVNITGGTLTGNKALYAGAYTINITGGTFKGTSYAVYAYRPSYAAMTQNLNISGGTFSATGTDGKIVYKASPSSYGTVNIPITGGTFANNTDVKDYLADNYGFSETTIDGATWYEVVPTAIYYTTAKDGEKTFITDDTFTITDGSYYSFIVPKDVEGKNVTYKRTLNASWNCWYMPFNISATANDSVDFYEIYGNATEEEAAKFTVRKVTSGTIAANTPYLMKPKSGEKTSVEFKVENATLYSPTSDDYPAKIITTQSSTDIYSYIGIYTKKIPTVDDLDWYVIAVNGQFSKRNAATERQALNPLRFYMKITKRTDATSYVNEDPNNSKIFNIVEIGNDDDITGINGATKTDIKDNVIYNLQGQRVTNPTKGIYIINGKKVILK